MTDESEKPKQPSWLFIFVWGGALIALAAGVQFTAEAGLHALHVQMCPRDTFFAAAMENPHSTFIAAAYFLTIPIGMFVAIYTDLIGDLLRGRVHWDEYR